MNNRQIALACVALAAMAAAWYAGRAGAPAPATQPLAPVATPQADAAPAAAPAPARPRVAKDAPLPPADAPLKNTFADLQARADAGDLAASMRLTRDLSRCRGAAASAWNNDRATDDLTNRKTEDMTPEQLRTYQALLDAMTLRQEAVKKTQALCEGADRQMLDRLTPNIARAAQLGDAEARACWLGRGPLHDERALIAHPEALASYRSEARTLIDAGLAAGDWRVVDLLRDAYEPGAQSLLAGVVGSDAVQHYRYLKLYRLGADEFRAKRLDEELAFAASHLQPADLADADAWAQATFRQNFSGISTNVTPQGWDPCALTR